MEQVTLAISGMSCGSCVKHVKAALANVPGVTVNDVQVGSAQVSYERGKTPLDTITKAITEAGYEATVTPTPAASCAVPLKQSGSSCGCCH